uniref:Thyroglobulin type-1 domain-containing protein n=1 Tax=Romanomermis culicivorax TaxID=13658 RepID=A0A915I3J3_ROMCU
MASIQVYHGTRSWNAQNPTVLLHKVYVGLSELRLVELSSRLHTRRRRVNPTAIPSSSATIVASSTDQQSGNLSICQSQRQTALKLKNANKTYDFVPKCHENGSFIREQELPDGWRFCIDKKGIKVHGSMRSPHLPKITCAEYEIYAKQRDVEEQKMLKTKKTTTVAAEKNASSISKTIAVVKVGNASSSKKADAAGIASVTGFTSASMSGSSGNNEDVISDPDE